MKRVMVVDDKSSVLNALKRSLRREGWELQTFADPVVALIYANREPVDLVISDYRMPQMDGVTFLKEMRAIQPDAFRIVLSGQADMAGVLKAVNQAEIYRFITKPWDDMELRITIEQALNHRDLLLENRQLADVVRQQQRQINYQTTELERLEGDSPGITQVNWGPDGSIILSEDDY